MSSRNRGRGSSNQDADEERRLWKEIVERGHDVDAKRARSEAIGNDIIALETEICALLDIPGSSTAVLDDKLERLYRENVKICEEVQHLLSGESNGTNLMDSLNILAALRGVSEETQASAAADRLSQRSSTAKGGRARPPPKAKPQSQAATHGTATPSAISTTTENSGLEEGGASTAAPSPRIHISTVGRLSGGGSNAKESKPSASSRANSVAATREPSVKLSLSVDKDRTAEKEDGAESVASSTDIAGTPSATTGPASASASGKPSGSVSSLSSRPTNRLVLRMGEIVFCRHDFRGLSHSNPSTNKPGSGSTDNLPEGEGILCRVTNVIGEGKQRRYEVQDADTSGEPLPPPQRASVSQLMQIPLSNNKGLSDLAKGRGVLAQYPDTTTFYKAEVAELWKGRKVGEVGGGGEVGMVRLNFQDDEVVREVERRFVLTEK
ncbi:hypothetical protein LTR97_009008 [Elasticomyces elasticus]|uniref:SGF29 C-terminal domain-containing protein n=1 Tax=Elasticomyces elasticus TaxID=574655 RepID=A0AAN7W7C2_9PEZI|nr:hypothetical protein LTR97_009008 [Elasticomyces elasticus]